MMSLVNTSDASIAQALSTSFSNILKPVQYSCYSDFKIALECGLLVNENTKKIILKLK